MFCSPRCSAVINALQKNKTDDKLRLINEQHKSTVYTKQGDLSDDKVQKALW